MSCLVAVTGKGGTGKTTVSAALVRLLVERGVRPVLAVDADPNHNLAPILGVAPQTTLSDIREEIMASKSRPASLPKDRLLRQRLEECLVEAEGFDLLTMGRSEGPSCYCYVNNLLREALRTLKAGYRAVVIDNEAGMEHLSRMNVSSVDCLLVVSEPAAASARAAARIVELAASLRIKAGRRVLAWNKVGREGVPAATRELAAGRPFDAELFLPADAEVARLAACEESVFGIRLPPGFADLAEACSAPPGKKG